MRIPNRFRARSAALAGAAGIILACGAALAEDVPVAMDQMRLVTFSAPVKTVLVANPVIADVTVIDAKRIFVLGKNFGTTNLVALDAAGNPVANDQIVVSGREGQVVTLQRGAAQTTLACSGDRCQVAPVPGDDKEPFESVSGQIEKREALAKSASAEQ